MIHISSKDKKNDHPLRSWYLPPLGQRIIKTSIAVFLCLIIYRLRGLRGSQMSAEAPITAIICMQPYLRNSGESALTRFTGSILGVFWGLAFLLLMYAVPVLGRNPFSLYFLMGLGILISLYSAVAIRKPDMSSLAAIVFICVVISYPYIDDPFAQALDRMDNVLVGTAIAIIVNMIRLPRSKCKDTVFFVRTKDLVPDQLGQIPSPVLFRLNHLFNDGAKICLVSEHAPSFFMSQMSAVHVTTPLIVMDGAAIYDTSENSYLSTINIDPEASRWLMEHLDALNIHYFVYTIHKNRNCIYHSGPMNEAENVVYQHLKRSPYRHYLDDDDYDLNDIVYIKVVDADEKAETIQKALQYSLDKHGIRTVLRPQAGLPGSSSLYFYATDANTTHAQMRLMQLLREKEPMLQSCNILPEKPYRTEHDAIHLLHTLADAYEPVRPLPFLHSSGKSLLH